MNNRDYLKDALKRGAADPERIRARVLGQAGSRTAPRRTGARWAWVCCACLLLFIAGIGGWALRPLDLAGSVSSSAAESSSAVPLESAPAPSEPGVGIVLLPATLNPNTG